MNDPVDKPVNLASSRAAIASLNLPAAFDVSFTDAAATHSLPVGYEPEEQATAFEGLSTGSVLAAALAQFGLGYRVKSGQNGKYNLEVDVGTEADNMYPVGWKNTAPIMNVVPMLWKRFPVDLKDANLKALVELISAKLELPHIYSSLALKTAGKDLAQMKYSRKPDKLTMELLMNVVSKSNGIGLCLRTDEAGNVFLWVTSPDDARAFDQRFAHVKPVVKPAR